MISLAKGVLEKGSESKKIVLIHVDFRRNYSCVTFPSVFWLSPKAPITHNVTRSKTQRQTQAACTGSRGRPSCGNTRWMDGWWLIRFMCRLRGRETACQVARFGAGPPGRSAAEGFRWARFGDGTVSCGGPRRHRKLGRAALTAPEEGPN
jgi:hypothetical protein